MPRSRYGKSDISKEMAHWCTQITTSQKIGNCWDLSRHIFDGKQGVSFCRVNLQLASTEQFMIIQDPSTRRKLPKILLLGVKFLRFKVYMARARQSLADHCNIGEWTFLPPRSLLVKLHSHYEVNLAPLVTQFSSPNPSQSFIKPSKTSFFLRKDGVQKVWRAEATRSTVLQGYQRLPPLFSCTGSEMGMDLSNESLRPATYF